MLLPSRLRWHLVHGLRSFLILLANVDYDLDALKLLIAALLVACSWPLGMFL